MNIERLQLKGMLAESKKRFHHLDTEASALVILIRSLLSPFEETLSLDTEKALVSLHRLDLVKNEMKTLSEKIKNLEQELE